MAKTMLPKRKGAGAKKASGENSRKKASKHSPPEKRSYDPPSDDEEYLQEEEEEEDDDDEGEEEVEEEEEAENPPNQSAGPKSKKSGLTPRSLKAQQEEARGLSPSFGQASNGPALGERFAQEGPRVEGGIRSAAKWLAHATLYSNGRGATPYPTEKQYLAMICDYEGVDQWWDATGAGEPKTALQTRLYREWSKWIKSCVSVTFTNTRARVKKETMRLFFLLYRIKQVQVRYCKHKLCGSCYVQQSLICLHHGMPMPLSK